MAKAQKKPPVSEQTREEAMKIARGIQKQGQTKEQTKLIAQGIQKGIDQYKKQQKAKARELDKQRKKQRKLHDSDETHEQVEGTDRSEASSRLPWVLLFVSWGLFIAYLLNQQGLV